MFNKRRVAALSVIMAMTLLMVSCMAIKIKTVTDDPLEYRNKFVTVKGEVTSLIPIPLTSKGLYEVTDNSGAIWVYTERGLPKKERMVSVTGEVQVSATFANRSFGVVLVEQPKREKK